MSDDANIPSSSNQPRAPADATTQPLVEEEPRQQRPGEAGKDSSAKMCGCSDTGRNLVVCLDGTANQFGRKNTNVIELYHLIVKPTKDDKQLTFYNSGIGTYARPSWRSWNYLKQVVDHTIDLAIAWNFERIIMSAYHWLSENYVPGDRIFLFGFSRGAYQVRALSAMIHKVGLLHKGNEGQIPFAYELYADPKSGDALIYRSSNDAPQPPDTSHSASYKGVTQAANFKETFSRDVQVHFVGVWDTVSSVGIVRRRALPHATKGMVHVCFFRQALALAERRVKFLPEYARGGSTLPAGSMSVEADDKTVGSQKRPPHTKEVWFAGTHSDIGGGNVDNPFMDQTRPPLRWMTYEATAAGLRMDPFKVDRTQEDASQKIHESLTPIWWLLELLPLRQPSYKPVSNPTSQGTERTTRRPHIGSGRKIQRGQMIHESVSNALHMESYTPKALPYRDQRLIAAFWKDLRNGRLPEVKFEGDFYSTALEVLHALSNPTTTDVTEDLQRLHELSDSVDGRRALVEAEAVTSLLSTLERSHTVGTLSLEMSRMIVQVLMDLVISQGNILGTRSALRILTSKLLDSSLSTDNQLAREFLMWFSTAELQELYVGIRVLSVAFSPDGTSFVSGVGDNTVRIWDATTGEAVGESLRGHILAGRQVYRLWLGRRDNSDLGCEDREGHWRALARAQLFGLVCRILAGRQVHCLWLGRPDNLNLGRFGNECWRSMMAKMTVCPSTLPCDIDICTSRHGL